MAATSVPAGHAGWRWPRSEQLDRRPPGHGGSTGQGWGGGGAPPDAQARAPPERRGAAAAGSPAHGTGSLGRHARPHAPAPAPAAAAAARLHCSLCAAQASPTSAPPCAHRRRAAAPRSTPVGVDSRRFPAKVFACNCQNCRGRAERALLHPAGVREAQQAAPPWQPHWAATARAGAAWARLLHAGETQLATCDAPGQVVWRAGGPARPTAWPRWSHVANLDPTCVPAVVLLAVGARALRGGRHNRRCGGRSNPSASLLCL